MFEESNYKIALIVLYIDLDNQVSKNDGVKFSHVHESIKQLRLSKHYYKRQKKQFYY